MALLIFTDGSRKICNKPDDEARLFKVWQVKTGREIPDSPQLAQYCEGVKKVILNWHTAPEEYVRAHINDLLPQILADWVVGRDGVPLRPGSAWGWEFAKKYGLMKGYTPTNLVTKKQGVLL
jgi:hypothetical protein